VPNRLVGGAALAVPNVLFWGAAVPNTAPDGAALVVLCPKLPNGLLCGGAAKRDAPAPNAGAKEFPLAGIVGAGAEAAN